MVLGVQGFQWVFLEAMYPSCAVLESCRMVLCECGAACSELSKILFQFIQYSNYTIHFCFLMHVINLANFTQWKKLQLEAAGFEVC